MIRDVTTAKRWPCFKLVKCCELKDVRIGRCRDDSMRRICNAVLLDDTKLCPRHRRVTLTSSRAYAKLTFGGSCERHRERGPRKHKALFDRAFGYGALSA